MNIEEKNPNQILANQIQEFIKSIKDHDYMGFFIPEMRRLSSMHKPVSVTHNIKKSELKLSSQ